MSKSINYIHNIFISQGIIIDKDLPFAVRRNVDSFKECHKNSRYFLWQEPQIRSLIKENFSSEVLEAFDCLSAFALKADLARYCILYVMGGLYSDLSNYFFEPMRVNKTTRIAAFKDRWPLAGAFWLVQNTIIYAEAQAPEMDMAIKLCVKNIQERAYGNSSLEPTGPALFGRILSLKACYEKYEIGKSISIDNGDSNKSHYVSSDGRLVAIRLQGGGGRPSQLGLKKTNVYGELWDNSQIFDERVRNYPFDSPRIRSKNKKGEYGINIEKDTTGLVVYGPYIPLYEGTYDAEMLFSNIVGLRYVYLDICYMNGRKYISKMRKVPLQDDGVARLKFCIDTYIPDLEVRLKVPKMFEATFEKLSIIHLNGQEVLKGAPPQPVEDSKALYICRDTFYIHTFCVSEDETEKRFAMMEKDCSLLYPSAIYERWNNNRIRNFIKENFDDSVFSAYKRLESCPLGEDLAKYCILYIKGGLFISNPVKLILPLRIESEKDIIAFLNQPYSSLGNLSVDRDIIFSRARQPEFNILIEWLTEKSLNLQKNILCNTSESSLEHLLCSALAFYGRTKRYVAGQLIHISSSAERQYKSYILDDGSVFAVVASSVNTVN